MIYNKLTIKFTSKYESNATTIPIKQYNAIFHALPTFALSHHAVIISNQAYISIAIAIHQIVNHKYELIILIYSNIVVSLEIELSICGLFMFTSSCRVVFGKISLAEDAWFSGMRLDHKMPMLIAKYFNIECINLYYNI